MDNVPGILTAVGGLPQSTLLLITGLAFLFWGINRMKWNKIKPDGRKIATRTGGTLAGVAVLWMLAIAFLPYFIGGPK